jgi:spermidine/putrescine transport system permease protein
MTAEGRSVAIRQPTKTGRAPWFMAGSRSSGLLLLSPLIVTVIVLVSFPLISLTAYSFWTQNYLTLDTSFTLANYAKVLLDWTYLFVIANSIWIASLSTLIVLLLAYPLAYFIVFYGGAHRNLWLLIITLPFWMSFLLRIFAWKIILGYNGAINSALTGTGLVSAPLEFLIYSETAIVITMVHSWLSLAVLPIFASLDKIDRLLLEASRDLGDTSVMTFTRVVLPLSMPGVISAALLVFIPSVADYATPALVGGAQNVLVGMVIQTQFGSGNDWPLGAALALVTGATIGLIILSIWLAAKLFKGRAT